MPAREDITFFGAGPSGLPDAIVASAAGAFTNYQDSGLGLAEISHRSPTATSILNDTKAALISLLDIPSNYEILFLHGGGSGEFSAVVYNLLPVWVERRRRAVERAISNGELGDEDEFDRHEAIVHQVQNDVRFRLKLDYLVTGSWSLKASQEAAQLLGPLGGEQSVNVAVDARKFNDGAFGVIPPEAEWRLTTPEKNQGCEPAFVYYCDNETVDGVEFPRFPKVLADQDTIVVADMSSNIVSRRVDVSKFGVIFAGAQKNIGITDTTIVIVRKDLLEDVAPTPFLHAVGVWSPPAILNWSTVAKNKSLYNTMPIFSIWVAKQVLDSLLSQHKDAKLLGQETLANKKAELLYHVIDAHPHLYQAVAAKDARSRMNICFRLKDVETEKKFFEEAKARKFLGLEGHRSVKGVRISNYNVIPLEKAQKLAGFMKEFATKHG